MIHLVDSFTWKPGDHVVIDNKDCVLGDNPKHEIYKEREFKSWGAYCEEVDGWYPLVEMLQTRQ